MKVKKNQNLFNFIETVKNKRVKKVKKNQNFVKNGSEGKNKREDDSKALPCPVFFFNKKLAPLEKNKKK